MAALLLLLFVVLTLLLVASGIVYVVATVREQMRWSPEAVRAIYDHVFLPLVVGPSKPDATPEEPYEVPTIDLSEYKL